MPGIFKVVAGGRIRGVAEPEFCLIGGLELVSFQLPWSWQRNCNDLRGGEKDVGRLVSDFQDQAKGDLE